MLIQPWKHRPLLEDTASASQVTQVGIANDSLW
jgi:hypothetical protein